MRKIFILIIAIFATTLTASKLQNYISQSKDVSLSTVKTMVENGADVNGDEQDLEMELIWPGATPLYYAAAGKHFDIVKYLVEKGADVNLKGRGTPLNVAAYLNEYKITKYLLEHGANPYIRNYKGYDSFFLGKKDTKILALLNKHKVKGKLTYEEELKAPYGINVDFKYYTDVKNAIKEASAKQKPIFVLIGRYNCKYCRIFKAEALSDKKVLSILKKDFVVLVLDAKYPVPQKYRTPGVPAMWFLDTKGEPMFQPLVGAVNTVSFLKALDSVKKEFTLHTAN